MAWLRQRNIDDEKRTPHILVKMKSMIAHMGFRTKRVEKDLRSLGVESGMNLVDFGCGTGIYTIAAARIVGENGIVHAVDLHPTLLEMIEKKAAELGLKNIETIYSDLETGVDRKSVDIVLLCDVLKGMRRRRELLGESHRIMRDSGSLLVTQSRMKDDRVKELVIKDGFFSYRGKHGKTMRFRKIKGVFHEIS